MTHPHTCFMQMNHDVEIRPLGSSSPFALGAGSLGARFSETKPLPYKKLVEFSAERFARMEKLLEEVDDDWTDVEGELIF